MDDVLKHIYSLARWSPKPLPKHRGGVCMAATNHGDWINRNEVIALIKAHMNQERDNAM